MSIHEFYTVSLSDSSKAQIFYGAAATRELKKQLETFQALIIQELSTTYEIPDLPLINIRIYLRKRLLLLVKSIRRLSPTLKKSVFTPFLTLLYPPGWFFSPTLQEELEWGWADAQKQMNSDSFALAKIGDEIVAISAYKFAGKLASHRGVFEITKSFTLPKARGKGLNTLLEQKNIQIIKDTHPNAAIMTMSKNSTIISRYKKLRWQEKSLAEYSDIILRINRSGISSDAIAVLQHWKCFLYDPENDPK